MRHPERGSRPMSLREILGVGPNARFHHAAGISGESLITRFGQDIPGKIDHILAIFGEDPEGERQAKRFAKGRFYSGKKLKVAYITEGDYYWWLDPDCGVFRSRLHGKGDGTHRYAYPWEDFEHPKPRVRRRKV